MEREQINIKSLEYVFEGLSKSLEDDYTCPICRCIMVNPRSTSCGHTFCSDCIQQAITSYLSKNEGATMFPCPVDRTLFDPCKDLSSPPYIVTSLLDNLTVICPFASRGCQFQGPRWTLGNHLEAECQYVKVKCVAVPLGADPDSSDFNEKSDPKNICGEMTERRFLESCISEDGRCCHELVRCDLCSEQVLKTSIDVHLALHCPESSSLCSLCGQSVNVTDLNTHMSEFCPESIITCTAAVHGCPWTELRKDSSSLQQHLKTCQLVVLAPALRRQDNRLKALEKENQLLRFQMDRMSTRCGFGGVGAGSRSRSTARATAAAATAASPPSVEQPQSQGPQDSASTTDRNSPRQESPSSNWTERALQHMFIEGESLRRDTDRLYRRLEEMDVKQARFIMQETQRASEEAASLRLMMTGLRNQMNFLMAERNMNRPLNTTIGTSASISTNAGTNTSTLLNSGKQPEPVSASNAVTATSVRSDVKL